MNRSFAMYKTCGISFVLLTLWAGAQAQAGVPTREMPVSHASEPDRQAQRLALRSALQAQRGAVNVSYNGAPGVRELSVQERGELRQQLRQQRRVAQE